MKKYTVRALVTSGLYTTVRAKSKKDAIAKAKERTIAEIHQAHRDHDGIAEEEWVGEEFDGEPFELEAEETE